LTSDSSSTTDTFDEYDLVTYRNGRRIWIALLVSGLTIIAACIALSLVANAGSVTDVPNHDIIFPLPLMAGSALLAVGLIMIVLGHPMRKAARPRRAQASLSVVMIVATLIVCGYVLNPMISPIAYLRDSDLDGVQDYSDVYPDNHFRVDYPWVSFWMHTQLSYTNDEWKVLIGRGGYSCWPDATAIRMMRSDNSTGLEQTLLEDLSETSEAGGIRYYNVAKLDRLDEGDYFLIDRQEYTTGSRIIIMGFSEYGWQMLTMCALQSQ